MSETRELPEDGKLEDNRLPKWLEEEVDKLVVEMIGEGNYLGYCHLYWAAKKKILFDKYGIEWMTPAEEFPGVRFD